MATYTANDHLAHLKQEKVDFASTHSVVCWDCWHSIRRTKDGMTWICHHCGRKVKEIWLDFINYFEQSGLLRKVG